MFEIFESRRTITGKIVATTALHIGAAQDEFSPNGEKNAFMRDASGQPIIPGSSLKGVMRSFLESILAGKTPQNKDERPPCSLTRMCIEPNDDQYKTIARESTRSSEKEKELAEHIQKNTCVICRLFGSQVNGAKFMIRDAFVMPTTFTQEFERRTGVSMDRDLRKAAEHHVFPFEIVPENTAFAFEAIVENANETEWQCVCIVLKAMEKGLLSLGGMTSRGLGSVQLKDCEVSQMDQANLLNILLNGENAEKRPLADYMPTGGIPYV